MKTSRPCAARRIRGDRLDAPLAVHRLRQIRPERDEAATCTEGLDDAQGRELFRESSRRLAGARRRAVWPSRSSRWRWRTSRYLARVRRATVAGVVGHCRTPSDGGRLWPNMHWEQPQPLGDHAVRARGRAGPSVAACAMTWVTSPKGSAAFVYAMAAPEARFRESEDTFAQIFESFRAAVRGRRTRQRQGWAQD